MIKANELRIGSLVWFEDELLCMTTEGQVKSITDREAEVISIKECNKGTTQKEMIIDLEPIPLDEDWLLKFGFEIDDLGWGYNHPSWRKQGRWIDKKSLTSDKKLKHPFLRFDSIADIYYVHQLQNFYFALTGQELTIKENVQV